MHKKDFENLQEEQEKEKIRRERRKKPKMRVSGAGVKRLQRIIGGALGPLFFILLCPLAVFAQENVVKDFSVEIAVQTDAEICVSEKISFDFISGHKGVIFRRLPSRYEARGTVFELGISDISVLGPEGATESFSLRRENGFIELAIGEPEAMLAGLRTYTIDYSVRRAINFFSDYDELYWLVTGYDWPIDIEQSKVTVSLPLPSAEDKIRVECFAGQEGSRAPCISERFNYAAKARVESVVFVDDRLPSGQGMSIALGWEKGIVAKPNFSSKLAEVVRRNLIFGLPVFSLFAAIWLRQRLERKQKQLGKNVYRFFGVMALLGAWFFGPLFDWLGAAAIILSGLIILAFSFLPQRQKSE